MSALHDGYVLRHTRADDVAGAQAVVDAAETALAGEPRRGEFEVAVACRDARVDLATNTWVVEAPDGDLAGFSFVSWGETAQADGEPFVHPDHVGRGVGGALLDVLERRAAELAGAAPPGVASIRPRRRPTASTSSSSP